LRDGNSPDIQHGSSILPAMPGITTRLFRAPQLRCIAALAAIALTSDALAANAVVGRESGATVRARVVQLVNAARSHSRKCGSERFAAAPPLSASRKLDDAAAGHARDMAGKRFFDHRGADGSQPKDRVIRAGYQPRLTGENIAYGPESAEEAVSGLLASPGHCANIMDPRFQHIGVALATGRGRGQIYWVQNFGAPRSGN
jgi:uncharacterized protein YkwD